AGRTAPTALATSSPGRLAALSDMRVRATSQLLCSRASWRCVAAVSATATTSAIVATNDQRRLSARGTSDNAAATAVAVAASTRYSTDVAVSQRLSAVRAMAVATIHPEPRHES